MIERAQDVEGAADTSIHSLDFLDSLDELELELRRLPGVRAAGFSDVGDAFLIILDVDDPGDAAERLGSIDAVRIAARHVTRPVAVELNRHAASSDLDLTDAKATREHKPEPRESVTATGPSSPETAASPVASGVGGSEEEAPDDVDAETEELTTLPRPRLLSVLAFPDTDEVEVHLVFRGQRTIGRAVASAGIDGVAQATVAAVRELEPGFSIDFDGAQRLDDDGEPLVAVTLTIRRPGEARMSVHGIASSSGPMDATARATLSALNRHLGVTVTT